MSLPIQIVHDLTHSTPVQASVDQHNSWLLHERESKGRRTLIRLSPEVYGRRVKSGWIFGRLRNKHVLIDCPNAQQAELVIEAIRRVCMQFDGKMLVPPPADGDVPRGTQ